MVSAALPLPTACLTFPGFMPGVTLGLEACRTFTGTEPGCTRPASAVWAATRRRFATGSDWVANACGFTAGGLLLMKQHRQSSWSRTDQSRDLPGLASQSEIEPILQLKMFIARAQSLIKTKPNATFWYMACAFCGRASECFSSYQCNIGSLNY